jgi:hypothetical protein
MNPQNVSQYNGCLYKKSGVVLLPTKPDVLPAVYEFLQSPDFIKSIRTINRKGAVATATIVKVPFEADRWLAAAADRYPYGLPEPQSNDPKQWLFHGHPANADPGTALHVGLARLAGYRWPAEIDSSIARSAESQGWTARLAVLPKSSAEGILCVPPIAGERALWLMHEGPVALNVVMP